MSALTVLPAALLIAAFSIIVHGKNTEAYDRDDHNIVSPYAVLAEGDSGEKYWHKSRKVNRNPQDLSVSRDFEFYKQVASLDLTDPLQGETFLQFMDTRLAEKELNEEVRLVSENDSEAKAMEMAVPITSQTIATAEQEQVELREQQSALKPEVGNEIIVDHHTTVVTDVSEAQEPVDITRPRKLVKKKEQQGPASGSLHNENVKPGEETSVENKEEEQAGIARTREARLATERARQEIEEQRLTEERREAEEKASAEELRLAEESRIAEEKARVEQALQLAEDTSESEKAEQIKRTAINILPSRPIAYQIASEQAPGIINFDQAIARRFKVAGSYLDKGEHGNNIVKDHRGREFINVMAFWDVLVAPQGNGENYYYGSIQFPLGSRHPAIIKSIVPGDEITLGCKAGEVMILKGFETEGIDYTHGLIDAYLAYSVIMPDGTVAFQEVVRQPAFSLINVETGCMSSDRFSRSYVDPERMGHDKTLHALPVRE
ncbi:hypothetical protein [Endozoicomonas sp. SCSIO W0465]|uniref:hypothetical protein n=1 Tax=Endozoicomonas sp. SCSIO W0465 TaxID=2918516 RepID=UPI002074FD93|nr:hypothetical protein [Endozoicomonas sp. SCSIO W0465]USE33845.1 hypothetical protein MJO57_16870 [Endozoicomonas sp. SCSIO W0465]